MSIWYWHFVDVVWIFLFLMLYWWGNSSSDMIHLFNFVIPEKAFVSNFVNKEVAEAIHFTKNEASPLKVLSSEAHVFIKSILILPKWVRDF